MLFHPKKPTPSFRGTTIPALKHSDFLWGFWWHQQSPGFVLLLQSEEEMSPSWKLELDLWKSFPCQTIPWFHGILGLLQAEDAELGRVHSWSYKHQEYLRALLALVPREKLCRAAPPAQWQLGNSLILRLFLVNPVLLALVVPFHVAVTGLGLENWLHNFHVFVLQNRLTGIDNGGDMETYMLECRKEQINGKNELGVFEFA